MDSGLFIATKNERVLTPISDLKEIFHFGVGRNQRNIGSSLSLTSVGIVVLKNPENQKILEEQCVLLGLKNENE